MKKIILRFGLLAVALVLLMQLSKYSLVSRAWGSDLLIGVFAVLFLGMGILVSRYFFRSRASKDPNKPLDEAKIEHLGISPREYEVLQLMAIGKSNLEIGETLFISESTVKTHVSNLLVKLNARRRTEAISIAKRLQII